MNTLKNIFKSLYSNQAALDNKKMKWWVTIIIFVFSVFLPWIPALTSGYQTNGGAIFTAAGDFEVSTALKHVIYEEQYFKGITVNQNSSTGNYLMDMEFASDYYGVGDSTDPAYDSSFNWDNEYNGTSTKALLKDVYTDRGTNLISKPTNLSVDYYFDAIGKDVTVEVANTSDTSSTAIETKVERRVYLEVYFFPTLNSSTEGYSQYLTNFTNTVILNKDSNGVIHNAVRSYVLILQDYMEVYYYPFKTTTKTSTTSSSTTAVSPSATYAGNLNDAFNSLNVATGTSLYNLFNDDKEGKYNTINEKFNGNFVTFADKAARGFTIYKTWMNVLTLSIAAVASILVSSILVIIFMKKKNSIYRESNYWHAINTSVSMGLCPSILSMAFGFFASQFTTMILIAANLMRAVFIMNKICPPAMASGNSNKPVYQARD